MSLGASYYHKSGSAGELGQRYYFSGILGAGYNGLGVNTTALTANRLYASALYGGRGIVISRVMTWVTTVGTSTKLRFGIYNVTAGSAGALYPTSLLVDFGEVSTTTTGLKEITGLTQALDAGKFYAAAIVNDANATVTACRSNTVNGEGDAWLGVNSSLAGAIGVFVTHAYAALPDPFPAAAGATATNIVPSMIYTA